MVHDTYTLVIETSGTETNISIKSFPVYKLPAAVS